MKFKMYTESIHLLFLDFLRFTVDFKLEDVFNNYTVGVKNNHLNPRILESSNPINSGIILALQSLELM